MMTMKRRAKGFSLLELLLSVAIFTSLMLAVFNLLQTYAERELARATTKYMTTVAQAMDQILSNIDNFNALYQAAMTTGGGYQLIADATEPAADNIAKTFVVNGTTIQASRLLNRNFRWNSPIRSQVRILLRIADNPGSTDDTPALDVLVVTATPRPDAIVRRAAGDSSYAGGVIRTYNSKAEAEIVHSFGSWRFKPSEGLQATPWFTNELRSTLNSFVDGSYLVYYTYANVENKAGDYLYRVPDPDTVNKRRNTMYGAFNLGGNDIIGIDDLNVGNATPLPFQPGELNVDEDCENTVLCVNGTAVLKGSGTVAGDMVTNGSALISDSLSAQTMRVQNGMSSSQRNEYGAQSLFVVDGNGNDGGGAQDMVHVTGDATFEDGGTVQTGNLTSTTATTVTMPDGGELQTHTITDTKRISASDIQGGTFTANDQLRAGVIAGGNVEVAGRTGVIDIRNSNVFQYGGYYDHDNDPGTAPILLDRTLSAYKVNVEDLSVQNFGACTEGCGQVGP